MMLQGLWKIRYNKMYWKMYRKRYTPEENTDNLLKLCTPFYREVHIGYDDWASGCMELVFAVTGIPHNGEDGKFDNAPAIWGVLDRLGLAWGCGTARAATGAHMHQAKSDAFIHGVYINENGKWKNAV